MAVMHVGRMRLDMPDRSVRVHMGVRLARRISGKVRVLVVLVMHMGMRMRHRLVHMLVRVAFGEVQPDANSHERARCDEREADRLCQRDHCRDRPQERRGREIGPRARSTEMAKRNDIKRETHAITEKPDQGREQDCGGAGQRSAGAKPDREIDRSRDQALPLDDLQRIRERDLAREIVVETPGDAGTDNCERPKDARKGGRP